MHEESLTKNTKRVFEALGKSTLTKDFYLAGGSALALYLGHRFSVDLDWFSEKFLCTLDFKKQLSKLGKLNIDSQSEKTFNGSLEGVKISFFEYPYPLVSPRVKYKSNLYLAGKPDIAAMKLDAIASRGTRKDFIDIYFLLKEYGLEEILDFLRKKFIGIEYNEVHLLKSLAYFKDAEESKMPKMIAEVSWDEIKKNLTSVAKKHLADQ